MVKRETGLKIQVTGFKFHVYRFKEFAVTPGC